MINVLLIDDHILVRTGIRHMLEDAKGIKVVGEAATGTEAVQLTRDLHPQVVVLDFKLPDMSGLEVIARLLRFDPQLKILVLSAAFNDLFPLRAIEAGAHGYLTKNESRERLMNAIKTVYKGERVISPEIAGRMALAKIDHKVSTKLHLLSDREIEVMLMAIRNTPIKDIADRLFISEKTVHSYRSRIFEKLDVKNDVGLTLLAVREGWIMIEEAGS